LCDARTLRVVSGFQEDEIALVGNGKRLRQCLERSRLGAGVAVVAGVAIDIPRVVGEREGHVEHAAVA
jgi:hypothetical protein